MVDYPITVTVNVVEEEPQETWAQGTGKNPLPSSPVVLSRERERGEREWRVGGECGTNTSVLPLVEFSVTLAVCIKRAAVYGDDGEDQNHHNKPLGKETYSGKFIISNFHSSFRIRRANGTSNTTNATNTTSSNSSSTHRRPSLSTTLTHNHNHSAAPLSSSNANVYHPPHHFASSSNPPTNTQYKYPRDQLLGIFKNMDADKGTALNKVEALLGEWASSPGGSEAGGAANWSRPSENEGAEVCWDKEGTQKPIALKEMDEAEKEVRQDRAFNTGTLANFSSSSREM